MKPTHTCHTHRHRGRSRLLHRPLPSFSFAHNISSPMSRQSCDATIIHPSIALLQERFRELERVKAMRQQKELLKLFCVAEQVQTSNVSETPRLFFNPDLILPASEPRQGSFYLQPKRQTEHTCHPTNELAKFRSADTLIHIRNDSDESDVDTSLHL